jgi:hypothetical protein
MLDFKSLTLYIENNYAFKSPQLLIKDNLYGC